MDYPELGVKKRKPHEVKEFGLGAVPNTHATSSTNRISTNFKAPSTSNDPPSTSNNCDAEMRFYNTRRTLPVATVVTLTYHPRTATRALQMDGRTNTGWRVDFEIIRKPTEATSFRFDILTDEVTDIQMSGGDIKSPKAHHQGSLGWHREWRTWVHVQTLAIAPTPLRSISRPCGGFFYGRRWTRADHRARTPRSGGSAHTHYAGFESTTTTRTLGQDGNRGSNGEENRGGGEAVCEAPSPWCTRIDLRPDAW